VRLIPPQYVKPYVKTNKNDAIDAEAISEAPTRPTMRFTAVKSAERTVLVNALRGHCGESASLLRKDCPAPAT
jgi:transposase